MKTYPVTHSLGLSTYCVFDCSECGKKVSKLVQTYYGNKMREELKQKYPMLPDFDADDICECSQNEDDDDD